MKLWAGLTSLFARHTSPRDKGYWDYMKSALELALEKTDELVDKDMKLSSDQVAAIDEARKEYEAKWAEQEIVLKGRIAKVQAEADLQTFAEHSRQFQDEMNQVREKIFTERDEKIEKIRQATS